MKFLTTAMTGDLLLIKRYTPPQRPRPILARPAPRNEPVIIRLILWLLATLGRPTLATARSSWPLITPEALPVLRMGIVFISLFIVMAASLAAKGG